MPKKATKKTVKRIPIKPPDGITKRGKGMVVKRGGFLPLAAAAPILAAAGVPLAKALGDEAVKGVSWLIKKIRGKGVIRTGSSRHQGGRKSAVKRVVVRV
jgi:hypothetical protein